MNTAAQHISTTAREPGPGTPMKGGFFAGIIVVNGQRFGLVVSPKAAGESEGRWGERGTRIPAIAFGDGLANTEAMFAAGSPIAKWARDLRIADHDDWYVPSRDELELIYRNLKPGDDSNCCYYRDGENPSSEPPGHLYLPDNPAQTAAAAFQTGGAEALEEGWYWSSTQCSAYDAFVQDFSDGTQGYDLKASEWRVRAVRRFLIDSVIE